VKLGVHLPTTQAPAVARNALMTFAREAERRDVASLWVSDHVVIPRVTSGHRSGGTFPHPPDRPYLEPVAMLAAAAMCTTRARLGASVFILGHRHPVVMAKMLSTIDALSTGRLICGVGVGWWKEELEVLGIPFHARGRHANEVLRVFKTLWRDDNPSFEGEFFKFRDIGFAPKPFQEPHPPIWVGGDSPGALARVVACQPSPCATTKPPGEIAQALARLRKAADHAGRRFDTIELSMRFSVTDELVAKGAQAVIDPLCEYKRLGLHHMVLEFRREDPGRMLEILDFVTSAVQPAVDAA
jgi:probable F420-dependent oxidoreductase